ncbi:MAG: glycosyltransferase [Candidatus Taylorbacteria bacterium]|nr:glycosyltransferase [Candidatus Taylorbacteria bacterium]
MQTSKLLQGKGVNFLIIGNGHIEDEIRTLIQTADLSNVEWLSNNLPLKELADRMRECHISLGQFEKHERLERTIPHKAFESLVMGLPYVTGRAGGVAELLTDGKDCLMVDCGDPEDLAAKILRLKNSPELVSTIGNNGRKLFENKLTASKLAGDIIRTLDTYPRL